VLRDQVQTEPTSPDEPAGAPGGGHGPAGGDPSGPGWRRLLVEGGLVAVVANLLTLAFLKPLRTAGETFYGDVLIGWFGPEKHGTAQFLAQFPKYGFLPTWTRDHWAGEPFMANLQHAVLYPGNLPFWVLDTSVALKVVAATHIALAAAGMWAYTRIGLRTSMWGSLVAALAFGFGAQTLHHIVLINQLEVIAWTPLVLLGGHLVLTKGRLRDMVGTALAIGMQFLAGHPEEWVYTLVCLALAGVVWALLGDLGPWSADPRALWRGRLRAAVFGAGRLALSIGLFVLLFGWQLLPTLQLQEQGWRSAPSFSEQYNLPLGITVNALLPDYGNVLMGENVAYVGVAALGLAALGIVAGRRELRWVRAWTGVLSVLGVLMAVGLRSPLYRLAYDNVGIISEFRVPTRWLFLCGVGLAVAAAIGTDALLSARVGQPRRRALHAVGAVAALGVLLLAAMSVGNATIARDSIPWWLAAAAVLGVVWVLGTFEKVPRIALALVLVVTTGVELRQARPFAEQQVPAPASVYDDPGAVMALLGREGGRYVTNAGEPATLEEALKIPTPPELSPIQGAYYRAGHNRSLSARPAWAYATHAESPLGRDGGLMPLRTWNEFWEATVGAEGLTRLGTYPSPPSKWNFATLDFLGVRWFVTPALPDAEAEVLAEHGFTLRASETYVLVWERPAPPVARMQYAIDVVPGAAERIARLKAGYPLAERAMVEAPIPGLTDQVTPASPPQVTTETGQSRVSVRVRTEKAGLLVLADPWYPGWKAEVDGRGTEIHRVDHGFRGVAVPAGEHQVVFTYHDAGMQAGALLALATAAGLGALGMWARIRRRRRQRAAAEPATIDLAD